ncbi:MAG: MBL fold metallo-hydrolase [Ilumatobacter sp.]|nr:MBL fold metallo-hydrolase [Ilumatobacter sp.]
MPDQRSFASDAAATVTADRGQVAHRDHVAQSAVLARRFDAPAPGVWCLVGNGLSNQTFIDAPDGIIAIDTGESTEEMREAITELRAVTDRPIVAVLYTHFHYVAGTAAVFDDGASPDIPIWAHERVAPNRARTASAISPAYGRGLVEQFALMLPDEGPDGRVNVGLGHFYRNPAHAPFTNGYVPATHTVDGDATIEVGGLTVEVTHAPSDADDSVTYWFPSLGVAVNNLVWPALFNVFAIRGEEYRDPRILLRGLDHLLSLGAEHLVGAHGPPLSGAAEIESRVTKYRDAIQFLWDQAVRHTNRGATSPDLGHAVTLPEACADDYLTAERYGVAEHHVRQIRSGLFGWFDGDEAALFPLPSEVRARRMIDGFGGAVRVREQARAALDGDDVRWAIELATWLVRAGGDDADRALLAAALRTVAQRTPAANIRNWCLTRALSLEGAVDASRLYRHRFSRRQILSAAPAESIHILRVLLDPDVAGGLDVHLGWRFDDGATAGLHLRNSIACPTDGSGAAPTIACTLETWADVLTGARALSAAIEAGDIAVDGDAAVVTGALAVFDVEGLRT